MAFLNQDWRSQAFGILPQPTQYGQSNTSIMDAINNLTASPAAAPPVAAPVPVSVPAPVSRPSTIGANGLTGSIGAFSGFGGDPLAQALHGIQGIGDVTGIEGNYSQPEGFNMKGMMKNTFMNEDGGLNLENITGLLGSLGGIYGAIKSFGLAKDSLDFSKKSFNTNLANQKKSYNTALEDRASSRAAYLGRNQDDYYNRNKL